MLSPVFKVLQDIQDTCNVWLVAYCMCVFEFGDLLHAEKNMPKLNFLTVYVCRGKLCIVRNAMSAQHLVGKVHYLCLCNRRLLNLPSHALCKQKSKFKHFLFAYTVYACIIHLYIYLHYVCIYISQWVDINPVGGSNMPGIAEQNHGGVRQTQCHRLFTDALTMELQLSTWQHVTVVTD